MVPDFEVAAGSTIGREHVAAGRNNQDAFCYRISPEAVLAVVADGCSAGRHSEVGARLGAALVMESLGRARHWLDAWAPASVLELVRADVLQSLRTLAADLGGSLEETVADQLLFTVVGAAVTPTSAVVFSLGDGVAVVNGDAEQWTFPDNRPPYLSEGLLRPEASGDFAPPQFAVHRALPATEVESILIGSDGVADLLRSEGHRLPGRDERVGPVRQFWEDDRYFRNPAAVARRLAVVNRDWRSIDWGAGSVEREAGLLRDDTTLVVIRRRRPR